MNEPKYRPSFTASQLEAMESALCTVLAEQANTGNSLCPVTNQALRIVQLQLAKINIGIVQPAYIPTGPRVSQLDLARQTILESNSGPAGTGQAIDWESPETWARSYQICQIAESTGMPMSEQDLVAANKHAAAHNLLPFHLNNEK